MNNTEIIESAIQEIRNSLNILERCIREEKAVVSVVQSMNGDVYHTCDCAALIKRISFGSKSARVRNIQISGCYVFLTNVPRSEDEINKEIGEGFFMVRPGNSIFIYTVGGCSTGVCFDLLGVPL